MMFKFEYLLLQILIISGNNQRAFQGIATQQIINKRKMLKTTIFATIAAKQIANCYLTQGRPVTTSANNPSDSPGSNCVDNNFDTFYSNTKGEANPWINVQLDKIYTISCILWIPSFDFHAVDVFTNIHIGNDPDLVQNEMCRSDVLGAGLYTCASVKTGNFIGARRAGGNIADFYIAELRAYEGQPLTLSVDYLTDGLPTKDLSLEQALSFDQNEKIEMDRQASSFSAKFLVDFQSTKSIKAVVVYTAQQNWEMRFGPFFSDNPIIFTASSSRGGEILVNSSGRYLQLLGKSGTLNIYYIDVIQTTCAYDCSQTFLKNSVIYIGNFIFFFLDCYGNVSQTEATVTPAEPMTIKKIPQGFFGLIYDQIDLSLAGKTIEFTITFTDPNAPEICKQPKFNVLFKQCTTTLTLNCACFTSTSLNYFLTETTELTIPQCGFDPSLCPDITNCKLQQIPPYYSDSFTAQAPEEFAKLTKNQDGSFKIMLNSSDAQRIGEVYIFPLKQFNPYEVVDSIPSGYQFLPGFVTLNVHVKCIKVADCSLSVQDDVILYRYESLLLTIPKCKITAASNCPNTYTVTGFFDSTGQNTPPVGFAYLQYNDDNPFQISLQDRNYMTIPEGTIYQFSIKFTDSDAKTLIPPSKTQFSVKICEKPPLVLSSKNITIKQMDTPQTIKLSNPTSDVMCVGSFKYDVRIFSYVINFSDFVELTGSTITIRPKLDTVPIEYEYLVESLIIYDNDRYIIIGHDYFFVKVDKCQVEEYTAADAIADKYYVVGSPKILVPIPDLTQIPNCGTSVVFTLNDVPSFIKVEGKNVALFGSDLKQARTIDVILTATSIESVAKIELRFKVIALINTPPKFFPDLTKKTLLVGIATSWKLPPLTDLEDDAIQTILVKLGAASRFINFTPSRSEFYFNGDQTSAGIYQIFIQVIDSFGSIMNAIYDITINKLVPSVSQPISGIILNSTESSQTFSNKTFLNLTNTLDAQNLTNSTNLKEDLNLTVIECNKTTENSSCDNNQTQEANTTAESEAEYLAPSVSATIPNSIFNFNSTQKGESILKTGQGGAIKQEIIKEEKPISVSIQLKILDWGCGAQLIFSQPLKIDKEKAMKSFSFAILDDIVNQPTIDDSSKTTAKRNLDEVLQTQNSLKVDVIFAPDNRSINYQVTLENPYDISVGEIINSLEVIPQGPPDDFLSGLFKQKVEMPSSIKKIKRQLPAQIVESDVQTLKTATDATTNSSKFSVIFTGLLAALIAGSLGLIWGLVGVLQNIGIMAFVNVNWPGNAHKFINQINQIACLAIFPEFIFQPWMELFTKYGGSGSDQTNNKFNQRFFQMGLENTNPVINLDQSGFFIFLMLIWMCLVLLIKIMCRQQSKICLKLQEKAGFWMKGLFWNGWIRLIVEVFADIVLAGFVRITTFEFGTSYEKGLTIFSVFMLVACLFLIIAFSVILYNNSVDYENEEFLEKYGELLADVRPHSTGAAFFWIYFMLQRVTQNSIVIFLQAHSIFQIQLFIFLSVFSVIYIGWNRPYETHQQNNLELFNCVCTLLASYNLAIFSNFTDSGKIRYQFAWYFIGIVIVVCLVNIVFQLKDSFQEVILRTKKKYYTKRQEVFTKFRTKLQQHRAEKRKQKQFITDIKSVARARGRDPDLPDENGRTVDEFYKQVLFQNPEPKFSKCEQKIYRFNEAQLKADFPSSVQTKMSAFAQPQQQQQAVQKESNQSETNGEAQIRNEVKTYVTAQRLDGFNKDETEVEQIDTSSKPNLDAQRRKPAKLRSYQESEWYQTERAKYDSMTQEQKQIHANELKEFFQTGKLNAGHKKQDQRVKKTPAQRQQKTQATLIQDVQKI